MLSQLWIHKQSGHICSYKIQRIVGRRVLWDRKKSANEGVLGELGWIPIKYKFHERNLNFRARLHSLPDDRLAKQVYLYTLELEKKPKWLAYSDSLMKEYNTDAQWLASKGRHGCKSDIRKRVLLAYTNEWTKKTKDKTTLRFLRS